MGHGPHGEGFEGGLGGGFGGTFGVRRPLRFLAYKLELDEKQVAELAGAGRAEDGACPGGG